MEIQDLIMMGAILIGPLLAVQVTRYFDERKEIKDRKLKIFRTLMATRGYKFSHLHIEALNIIDIDFSKDKGVINTWKTYHSKLHKPITGDAMSDALTLREIEPSFNKLLHEISKAVGYDFSETEIEASSYAPILHEHIESQQNKVLGYVVDILEGKKSLPVHITDSSQLLIQDNNPHRPVYRRLRPARDRPSYRSPGIAIRKRKP